MKNTYMRVCVYVCDYNSLQWYWSAQKESSEIIAATVSFGGWDSVLIYVESAAIWLLANGKNGLTGCVFCLFAVYFYKMEQNMPIILSAMKHVRIWGCVQFLFRPKPPEPKHNKVQPVFIDSNPRWSISKSS